VFSRSTVIALLDRDGVILARTGQLTALDPAFMGGLQELTATVE